MWMYMKHEGYFFDLKEVVFDISPNKNNSDQFFLAIFTKAGNYSTTLPQVFMLKTKKDFEMFVSNFSRAIENGDAVFTWDSEAPRFVMRLSDRTSDKDDVQRDELEGVDLGGYGDDE